MWSWFENLKIYSIIIFANSARKSDEIAFDICHEIAHIVLGNYEETDEIEKKCNSVAQELIYPKEFFIYNKENFNKFDDSLLFP